MSTCGQAGVTTPPPLDPSTPPPAGRTYTDEDVNRIAAKERRDAEKRARDARDAELAEQWGVPIDQVQSTIDAAKAAADKDKTDAQREKEAAATARANADKALADAVSERHSLRVERSLLRAGVPADDADLLADAVTLVRVDPAADDKAIADAIEVVKGRHPGMFSGKPAATPPPGHTPPDVRPPSGRQTPPAGQRDPQLVQQLARRGINNAPTQQAS